MSALDDTIDPDEVDDFPWDWTNRLAQGETITTASVTVADGVAEVVAVNLEGNRVTARLSGAEGDYVDVLCRVTTSNGRELDDTWRLGVTAH